MVPNFFEISTPKFTKLANKINVGTKIEGDQIILYSILTKTCTNKNICDLFNFFDLLFLAKITK